ncbi:MAG: hypothetical protein ACI4GY_06450 [Acutalibacteraceae bacterium]
MNNFDELIEKYSRELVNAKSKSILQAIEDEEIEKTEVDNISSEDELTVAVVSENIMPQQEKENEKIQNNEQVSVKNEAIEEDMNEDLQNINTDTDPDNMGTGLLRVQVYAANQVYPISSAYVTVTDTNDDKIYFQGYTDTDGIVDNISLPAPIRTMSESPSRIKPYAQYNVTVEHPRFISRKYKGVPVFSTIKSVQAVQLVPSDNNGTDSETVTESESNELLLKTPQQQ